MTRNQVKPWFVLFVFVLIFALRLPYITNSPYEYDAWRQADTESIAINFVEQRFNLFYPQLNYEGAPPNYVQLEFQITTYLIAILYKWFGYNVVFARIVPIAFFMGSAVFLYRIGALYYNERTAVIALFLYGVMPINMLYSRAIMPEAAALFFFIGAFYLFAKWIETERRIDLLAAALFTALAIAVKVPTIFVGIPMLAMAVAKYKQRIWRRGELWLLLLLSIVPPYVYFQWLDSIAESKFVSGIATKHVLPSLLTAFFSDAALQFFYKELPAAFTWTALVLFAIGLLRIDWRRQFPVGIWALAMIVELMTVVSVIKFNYYLIFIGPLVALLGAAGIASLYRIRAGRLWGSVLLAIVCLTGFRHIHPLWDSQKDEVKLQGRYVQQWTEPDDLIVVGTDDPSLLNASRRKGWRVTNTMPDQPIAELRYFINHGAKYFVPLKGFIYGDDGTLKSYLDARYKKLNFGGGYYMYKLTQE